VQDNDPCKNKRDDLFVRPIEGTRCGGEEEQLQCEPDDSGSGNDGFGRSGSVSGCGKHTTALGGCQGHGKGQHNAKAPIMSAPSAVAQSEQGGQFEHKTQGEIYGMRTHGTNKYRQRISHDQPQKTTRDSKG